MINARKALNRQFEATSLVLLIKGAVGGSLAILAVFGVSVPVIQPLVDIEVTDFSGGVVASVGALCGVIAAIRA